MRGRGNQAVLGRPPVDAGVLTRRELEVLDLVAEGLMNKEVAAQLVVSPATVRKHLENVYAKLGVHTRTAAVRASANGV